MRLSIETTRPQLQIQTTPGKLEVTREKEKLNIQNSWPKMTMHTTYSRVMIDQSGCFADCGLKDNGRLRAMMENDAQSAFARGIARKTQEGNRLKNITKQTGLAIPEIARANMYREPKEFVFAQIPSVRPDISFTPGRLDIKHNSDFARVNYQPSVVKLSYETAKVQISLLKEPGVQIRWIDERV